MTDKQLNEKFKSMLEPIPDDTSFLNGEGYILQDPDIIEEIRKYFIDKYGSFYVAGRTLDDSGSVLYRVFMRVFTVDKQYREWGQPFYANNPSQGKQICHNPEFEKTLLKKYRKKKLDQIENHQIKP